jgi:four helix bundle protein
MHHYKELKVWQNARNLVKKVCLVLTEVDQGEKYGLISQIKRSVISIPSNIAEGAGRETNKDFSRFLDISLGSAFELETQMILLNDLSFIDDDQFDEIDSLVHDLQRMIYGLKKSLVKA